MDPPINFAMHEVRANSSGASRDFEQMLQMLIDAIEEIDGGTCIVEALPGDWGIDVLGGRLDDRVVIFQAKYFRAGAIGASQRRQIIDSFRSAQKAAVEHGYVVERWVLCSPVSLDPKARQWWDKWVRERQAATKTVIELWDENGLRRRLLDSRAAEVRRAYYGLGSDQDATEVAAVAIDSVAAPAPQRGPVGRWSGGDTIHFDRDRYLLHDDAVERVAPDRSWVWREATGHLDIEDPLLVRLAQIEMLRAAPAAERCRQGLRTQAELATTLGGTGSLPRHLATHEAPSATTVVVALPPGRVWLDYFGPGPEPCDWMTAAQMLAAAADVGTSLDPLHRSGHWHGLVGPTTIVVAERDRAGPRDFGLAGMPVEPALVAAAPYRAAEQFRLGSAADARADVYALAALIYHSITGHPPGHGRPPPVRLVLPRLSPILDDVLAEALARHVDQRLDDMAVLTDAFLTARHELFDVDQR